jgi:hypothetical protein
MFLSDHKNFSLTTVMRIVQLMTDRSRYFIPSKNCPARALPWTRWDLKRSPDPSPTHAPPLTTNPGSAPAYNVGTEDVHNNIIQTCTIYTVGT